MPEILEAGGYREDVTERQGAIVRGAGGCRLEIDRESCRADWTRAVRIIMSILRFYDSGMSMACSLEVLF